MYYRRSIAPIVCLLLSLSLVACSGQQHKQAEAKPSISTTIAPVAYLSRLLAGDALDVHILLPQGSTPESYEPTPPDLIGLSHCKAYLYMGDLGFETAWAERIKAMYPDLEMERLDEGITLHSIENPKNSNKNTQHLHDPHYWMSFRGTEQLAINLAHKLCRLVPTAEARIDSALRLFVDELDDYKREQSIEGGQRAFVIYHPSLSYYAEEMGIRQLVVEQDGKEPTTAQLETLLSEARALGVRYVFIQREFNPQLMETIARELGAETIVLNTLGEDWITELKRIHTLLSQA